jgi:hypothetical protein
VPVNVPLDFIKAQKLMEVDKLSKAMTEIHKQVAKKSTRDRKAVIKKHNDKTHMRLQKLSSGRLRAGRGTPQERYVQVEGEVEGPASRRECGVRLRVRRGESAQEGAQGGARKRACNSIRTRTSTSQRIWPRPPNTTTTSCTSCQRYSTRATMNKRCFTSC